MDLIIYRIEWAEKPKCSMLTIWIQPLTVQTWHISILFCLRANHRLEIVYVLLYLPGSSGHCEIIASLALVASSPLRWPSTIASSMTFVNLRRGRDVNARPIRWSILNARYHQIKYHHCKVHRLSQKHPSPSVFVAVLQEQNLYPFSLNHQEVAVWLTLQSSLDCDVQRECAQGHWYKVNVILLNRCAASPT